MIGFHENRANVLKIVDGKFFGEVRGTHSRQGGQTRGAAGIDASSTGCAPEETLAVGDGANDLAMLEAAGLGVAYRAKPAVPPPRRRASNIAT